MRIRFFVLSEQGTGRENNEDNYLALHHPARMAISALDFTEDRLGEDEGERLWRRMRTHHVETAATPDDTALFVVADGLGRQSAGEVASRLAVDAVRNAFFDSGTDRTPTRLLLDSLTGADREIREMGARHAHLAGMATTFTTALLDRGRLVILHVGDSRAYLIRPGDFRQLTKDQTVAQSLADRGVISEEMIPFSTYRNELLQVVGGSRPPVPQGVSAALRNGDVLLLCTDGLTKKVTAVEMSELITAFAGDLERSAREMVDLARERGEDDDITVMLAQFHGQELGRGREEAIEARPVTFGPGDGGDLLEEFVEVATDKGRFLVPSTEFAVSTDVQTREEYLSVNVERLQTGVCPAGERVLSFRLVLLTEEEAAQGCVLPDEENDARWADVARHAVH